MGNDTNIGTSLEVTWQLDATTVYGTLVKPVGPGPFPAVVMVAGSGPTDRNWNSPLLPGTNGSGRLIAEALAQAGIASLRYDKRASGPHVRENMPALIGKLSMQSHINELAGAVRRLGDQAYIRKDRIFGFGNSEGTLHVLNYQLHDPGIPFAGLILTGAPGRAVGTVARDQLAAQISGLPERETIMALYDAAITRFLAGKPAAADASLPENFQMVIKSLENPANLPFSRELWAADATMIKEIKIPTLVIIGKKDIQVDWQSDGEPLQHAAEGHENVSFFFPENANHILKHESRPRSELVGAEIASGYSSPDTYLDSETMEKIVAWLTAKS